MPAPATSQHAAMPTRCHHGAARRTTIKTRLRRSVGAFVIFTPQRRTAQHLQRGLLRAPRRDPCGGLRMLLEFRFERGAFGGRQFIVDPCRQRSQIEPVGQAGFVVVVIHHGFLTTFNGGVLRAGS